jgi:hypothetical protein
MTWNRRRLFRLFAVAGAFHALAAFSPRGLDRWRQHSLFILFPDDDPSDRALVALVSRQLAAKLLASRAQPLAVPDLSRIGEFLLSRQYDLRCCVRRMSLSWLPVSPRSQVIRTVRLRCSQDFATAC